MASPTIKFGQIAWAEVADANGVRKARPVVVLTSSERITETSPLEVVAITSTLPQPLTEEYVLLPWHAQGHPRTGLKRKCAALCTWLTQISPSDIQSVAGQVPPAVLDEIMAKVRGLPLDAPDPPPEKP